MRFTSWYLYFSNYEAEFHMYASRVMHVCVCTHTHTVMWQCGYVVGMWSCEDIVMWKGGSVGNWL